MCATLGNRVPRASPQGARGEATAQAVLEAFNFAQMLARSQGVAVDISPNAAEFERCVAAEYAAGSTTVWRFEQDEIDSSESLVNAVPAEARQRLSVARLPGGHLAPVAFRLDASELDPALGVVLGGVGRQGFAVGNPALISSLSDAICQWIWPASMKPPPALAAAGGERELDVEV